MGRWTQPNLKGHVLAIVVGSCFAAQFKFKSQHQPPLRLPSTLRNEHRTKGPWLLADYEPPGHHDGGSTSTSNF
eukprot:2401363-Rhodomonas_salina.2